MSWRVHHTALFACAGALGACAGEPAIDVETDSAALIEHHEDWEWVGTHGKLQDPTYNLFPSGSVQNAETAAEAVVALGGLNNPFCTGFVVDDDLIMTADHCFRLDDGSMPPQLRTWATIRSDTAFPRMFDCTGPVHLDAPADVVTLRCSRDVYGQRLGDLATPVRLSHEAPAHGEDLFSITVNCRCDQWSTGCSRISGKLGPLWERNANGRCTGSPAARQDVEYRLLSPGGVGGSDGRRQQCRVNNPSSSWTIRNNPQRRGFNHNCDGLPGSSGGPVFSRYTGEVVGVVSSQSHYGGSWNSAGESWRFMRDYDANRDDRLDSEETSLGLTPWAASPQSPFDVSACAALVSADVDNDGREDWVCLRDFGYSTSQIWYQRATASGFRAWEPGGPLQFGTLDPSRCKTLLVDDFNYDGRAELVCPYDYGTQTRTFVAVSKYGGGFRGWEIVGNDLFANLDLDRCQSLLLADLSADGRKDLVCAYDYGNAATMTWVQRRGPMGYEAWSIWGAYHSRGTFDVGRCRLLAAADVNNDRRDDLVCTYDYGWGRTRTFVQHSSGTWGSRWQASGNLQYVDLSRCRTIAVGRANADVYPDLICVEDHNGWVSWTRAAMGNSLGFSAWQVLGPPERFDTGGCREILVADVDRDGRDDLVCPLRYPDGRDGTFSKRSSRQGWTPWRADRAEPAADGLDTADCAAFAAQPRGNKVGISCVEARAGLAATRTWVQLTP